MTSVVLFPARPIRRPSLPHLMDPGYQRRVALTLEAADEAGQAGNFALRDQLLADARREVQALRGAA